MEGNVIEKYIYLILFLLQDFGKDIVEHERGSGIIRRVGVKRTNTGAGIRFQQNVALDVCIVYCYI